jgi:cytochrome P450
VPDVIGGDGAASSSRDSATSPPRTSFESIQLEAMGNQEAAVTGAPTIWDLDLPVLNTANLDRSESIAAASELAKDHWLARTDVGVAVLRYRDVASVLRDQRFHNALSLLRASVESLETSYLSGRRPSILSAEGPDHTRLRRLVSPAFTPAAANRHRPTMRRVVTDLLEAHLDAGGCEFVADICEPYPIPIICEVLGAPPSDWRRFSAWATDVFKIFNGNLDEDLPAIERASSELDAYVTDMVEERRSDPRSDLLSELIAVEEEGDRLSNEELCMLVRAVLLAGTDTTRNQLGCAMALFAQHPDQWAMLVEDPERLAPKAVEESMRYIGAVRATVRVASCDVPFGGVVFPKGTVVTTNLAAANRDTTVFADADRFDITAERSAEHLTFGSGIHRCLGAALARAELQEALTVLARRLAKVVPDGPVTWKPPSFGIWGPASLPVTFTAR